MRPEVCSWSAPPTETDANWDACAVSDFTPEEFVRATAFRYITDAITQDEALALLRERQSGKEERIKKVINEGYPAYTTVRGHHCFLCFCGFPPAHTSLPRLFCTLRVLDVSGW